MEEIQKKLDNLKCEENWDYKGSATRYSTHGMHTYLAAMIPAVAKRIIELTASEKDSILDPYVGGGAVAVESILNNHPTYGIDINPLAVIISKAKTNYIDGNLLKSELNHILKNVHNFDGNALGFPDSYNINYWFKDYMMLPLTALQKNIICIKDDMVRNFFECVFSGAVRDVSLTYRNEQRLRRLVPKDLKKFNPDVIKVFSKRASDSIKRLMTLPRTASSNIQMGSVLDLPFENKSFSSIICSPPYGDERNGVPYSQFSKNMLIWLGYKREDLLNLKKLTLGGVKKTDINFESPYLEDIISEMTNEQNIKEAIGFYNDYYSALKEMIRVTNNYISIVIGNRTLQGRTLNNGLVTTEFMKSLGVELHKKYIRKLPQKRLPKMGNNKGAQINEEDILIYKLN